MADKRDKKLKEKRIKGTRAIAYLALFTALLIALSLISIPFGAIPVTLGLLGVLLCGGLLGWRLGTVSVIIYIIMGLLGLPVFAGFIGTPAIVGPTGGYIIGYIPAAFMAGMAGFFNKKSKLIMFALLLLAVVACYVCGTAWYAIYADISFAVALSTAVLPFLPADAVKVALAGALIIRIKKYIVL